MRRKTQDHKREFQEVRITGSVIESPNHSNFLIPKQLLLKYVKIHGENPLYKLKF